MRKILFTSLLCAVFVTATLTCALALKYEIRDLGPYDGHTYAAAHAINDAGLIAGRSGSHVVTWSPNAGAQSVCIIPEELTAEAKAVNKAGLIVGSEYEMKSGVRKAVLFVGRDFALDLGSLGGNSSEACGINDSGTVVGTSNAKGGQNRPFVWKSSTGMKELALLSGFYSGAAYSVNNAGQIAGYCGNSAVIWNADGTVKDLGTLKGYARSAAYGINASGQVVGSASNKTDDYRAFSWTSGKGMLELQPLAGWAESNATCIDDSGVAAGWVRNGKDSYRAVAWGTDGKVVDLGTLPKGTVSEALGINSAGYIVGRATDELGKTRAVMWVPVK